MNPFIYTHSSIEDVEWIHVIHASMFFMFYTELCTQPSNQSVSRLIFSSINSLKHLFDDCCVKQKNDVHNTAINYKGIVLYSTIASTMNALNILNLPGYVWPH